MTTSKEPSNIPEDVDEIIQRTITIEKIPTASDLRRLMDFFGDGWNDFCSKNGLFFIPSREFVKILAKEIKKLTVKEPVVELCAGSGKLSYWLRGHEVHSIATDDYKKYESLDPLVIDYTNVKRDRRFVQKYSHIEALKKYRPELALAAWVPPSSPVVLDALDFPSVKYAIEIERTEFCGIDATQIPDRNIRLRRGGRTFYGLKAMKDIFITHLDNLEQYGFNLVGSFAYVNLLMKT